MCHLSFLFDYRPYCSMHLYFHMYFARTFGCLHLFWFIGFCYTCWNSVAFSFIPQNQLSWSSCLGWLHFGAFRWHYGCCTPQSLSVDVGIFVYVTRLTSGSGIVSSGTLDSYCLCPRCFSYWLPRRLHGFAWFILDRLNWHVRFGPLNLAFLGL